jgi:hypothetical protein
VIATTDTAMTAATPPSAAISTAGTKATAALAGPTVEDNVKIEEPAPAAGQSSGRGAGGSSEGRRARTEEQNAPSEEPRPRRHAAAATASRKARTGGGAGLGATIRSIDIDGQHYNLQDGAPKNGASGDKAQ